MLRTDLLLDRAERLMERLERLLPPAPPVIDWNVPTAFRQRSGRLAIRPRLDRAARYRLNSELP